MHKLEIHPEVEADLIDIRAWYAENVDAQTASDCIQEIYQTMEFLCEAPYIYKLVEAPFRRALCKRFPYKIIFEPLDNEIVFILSVLHEKRHPDTWKERK